jgi:predicted CopG family antitoxin
MYVIMGTRTISVSDEAYARLKALKRQGESFSDVISRLTSRKHLSELAGVLNEKEAKSLEKTIAALRNRRKKQLEKTLEELKS